MIDVIGTDFGVVRLSPKVVGYLDGIDADWRTKAHNKRLRSKHAKRLRSEVSDIEHAVMTLARIEYCAGGVLVSL